MSLASLTLYHNYVRGQKNKKGFQKKKITFSFEQESGEGKTKRALRLDSSTPFNDSPPLFLRRLKPSQCLRGLLAFSRSSIFS